MRARFFAVAVLLLSCAWSGIGASAARAAVEPYRLPVPEIETLPNGLRIAWFLNPTLPVVDVVLVVRSGTRDDLGGKSGTATFLSSILDRGNAGMTAQQVARSIEELGASRYVSADDDQFAAGIHGLAPDADRLLDLLGKITLHPDFPKDEVAQEKARMLDRWKSMADYGSNLVSLVFHRALAADSYYARGGFLSAKEFRAVTREDAIDFYKKHFTPKNSILMVVGRVDRPDFRAKIQKIFGDWQGEVPAHQWLRYSDPRFAPKKSGEVLVINRPNLTQAEVRMGFKAPLYTDKRHYALVVANALLGEHFESRLNSLIREKLGLTYSISSGYSYSQYHSSFGISSATKTENVGKLIRKTLEVLRTLKKGPVPDGEIQVAKDYLIGGFPLGASTLQAVASRWINGQVYGVGPDYLNEFVPKVSSVTSADITTALAQTFDLDKMVIAVSGDAKGIEKSLAAAKIPYRLVSVADLIK